MARHAHGQAGPGPGRAWWNGDAGLGERDQASADTDPPPGDRGDTHGPPEGGSAPVLESTGPGPAASATSGWRGRLGRWTRRGSSNAAPRSPHRSGRGPGGRTTHDSPKGLIWGMASQLGERGSAVVRIGRYPSRRVNNRTRKRERFMRDDAVVFTLQAQNRLGKMDVVFF